MSSNGSANPMDAPPENRMPPPKRKGYRWPKGVSGNPGGVRKGIPQMVAECRRLALGYAPEAVHVLAVLLRSDPDPRVRIAAAEGLLDRAGLRPYALEPERMELTSPVDIDALRASLALRVAGMATTPAPATLRALPASVPPLGSGQPSDGGGLDP